MRNFRTLNLAVEFYRASRHLKLKGAIRDQFERASTSIVCNLAEGRGRPTCRDQMRFFHIAMGSVRECQSLLLIADQTHGSAWQLLDKVAACLYKLIRSNQ